MYPLLPTIVTVLVLLSCGSAFASTDCVSWCNIPMPGLPDACTASGVSIPFLACNISTEPPCEHVWFSTRAVCDMNCRSVPIVGAGSCECPNDCGTYRGVCKNGQCQCHPGYGGADCSTIVCAEQPSCNGEGHCVTIEDTDVDVCECSPSGGFQGDDCASPMIPLPPIQQTFPDTQYSAWDKYGNDHPMFPDSGFVQLRLRIDPHDLSVLLDPLHQQAGKYYSANFTMYSGSHNVSMDNVGMRIKGGISRSFAKKSWKISFNKFEKGSKIWQLKKISIKGASFDPTFARERLSRGLAYSMDSPIQRVAYASISINDMSYGFGIIQENIDEQFLKSRFGSGNETGAMWQVIGDLAYLGPNATAYQDCKVGFKVCYNPKTAAAETDWEPLVKFISLLNATQERFEAEIESVLDVETYIRAFVWEIASGQRDGIVNGNNFFLYQHPTLKKLIYMRGDLDLSFGMFAGVPPVVNFSSINVYDVADDGRGVIFTSRMLSVPKFRQMYTDYWWRLLDGYFSLMESQSTYVNRVLGYKTLASLGAETDMWHRLDLGWTRDDFDRNYVEPLQLLGMNIANGILPYIETRILTAKAQLDPKGAQPEHVA